MPLAVKLSLFLCVLAGIGCLFLSRLEIGVGLLWIGVLLPDLFHDFGIAFLVSAAVGALFELYRSNRHQMESMKDVIDFAMGDRLTGEIWQEVQELLEAKAVIRRSTRLRLQFENVDGINRHEALLRVDHEYDLYCLRPKSLKHTIAHELDYQLRNQELRLPRWEAVVVEPEEAKSNDDAPDLGKPRIEVEVTLASRQEQQSVYVRTERLELVNVPGSYNFYTPEFTKGLRLSIVACPTDVRVEVWVRPHGGATALPEQGHTWSYDQLIFPGQGIEVKFIRKVAHRENELGRTDGILAHNIGRG